MIEHYLSDTEYRNYYPNLNNLRCIIAADLPIESHMRILDLATGYGYFAIALAEQDPTIHVAAIDISWDGVLHANTHITERGLADTIGLVRMDATSMGFARICFDMVVNSMGLEDIHMTRGSKGINQAFLEVNKVLKPAGRFCFAVMPLDTMETEAQKTEAALYSFICDATWLTEKEYEHMLKHTGFELVEKRCYSTGKKLTPDQARTEIMEACEIVPRVYGRAVPTFKEIWQRFGEAIKQNGLGHCSKLVVINAQKVAHG
jgi:ubiquinone/menaquinone biosynthesis C-methylase UbiE